MPERTVQADTIIKRAPQVASRNIADKMVLMKAPISSLSKLNDVAAFIWDLIQEPKSINEIGNLLVDEFKVSYDDAMKDLFDFAEDLLDKDLIVVEGS